ncbi:MAG: DegT/DnrJ/EryC1/StrS family aminotransferase, partial [Thermoanaerobaculia bacterium]
LGRAKDRIQQTVLERWQSLLDRTSFVGGSEVEEFEKAFSSYLGVKGCVGVANGTDALVIALRALDLQPGDEVIVPAFTFIATAASVVLSGGCPVLADVQPDTLNIDPSSAAERISESTVGVIGVHLYGRPFDVSGIGELCKENGLWLIEDAAQAHGAAYRGQKVGGFGRLATWSFYPAKNLGCFGDGGAVTGNEPELLERVRLLANHGRQGHYHHVEVGTNSRLDSLQAAVLNCRLPHLESDNARRREVAQIYQDRLAGVGDLQLLRDPEDTLPVYHQFTIRTGQRDGLRTHLTAHGIGSAVHYPEGLHQQPAFSDLPQKDLQLPVATVAGQEVLCLPMFPEIADDEVEQVWRTVQEFFD